MKGSQIDWLSVVFASNAGTIMELLMKIPREHWADRDEYNFTLLFHICGGPNTEAASALLQSGLVDVNDSDMYGYTVYYHCAQRHQASIMEVLCAARADVRKIDYLGYSTIDFALEFGIYDDYQTTRVLIANGVRLSTVHHKFRRYITQELVTFERGILRCRQAVIAMIRIKNAAQLRHVDRFLLREIGFAIWATRWNIKWP